jgi:hypothetical protein
MQFTVQLALDDDDKLLVGYIYMQGVCARSADRARRVPGQTHGAAQRRLMTAAMVPPPRAKYTVVLR